MVNEKICLYNKFGHCKFRETCRLQHINEICEIPSCETETCLKRHPRSCRFFTDFKRCKFGTYCSFSHKIPDTSLEVQENGNVLREMISRLNTLETVVKQNENEVKNVNEKLKTVEEKNLKLEKEMKTVLESVKAVSEIVVKEATEALIDVISKQQDEIEKRSEIKLDSLNNQLAMIFNLLQPSSSQTSSQQHSQEPQPSQSSPKRKQNS